MKQLLPVIAIFFILTGCRKFNLENQIPPGAIQADIVAENINVNEIFCTISTAAEFPGGTTAWHQFLQQNLTYPETAIEVALEGTVVVLFIVDTNGAVSNIEAISGPDVLKESAVEVLKKSPNWVPAHINGRNITEYKRQPIIFRLEVE